MYIHVVLIIVRSSQNQEMFNGSLTGWRSLEAGGNNAMSCQLLRTTVCVYMDVCVVWDYTCTCMQSCYTQIQCIILMEYAMWIHAIWTSCWQREFNYVYIQDTYMGITCMYYRLAQYFKDTLQEITLQLPPLLPLVCTHSTVLGSVKEECRKNLQRNGKLYFTSNTNSAMRSYMYILLNLHAYSYMCTCSPHSSSG